MGLFFNSFLGVFSLKTGSRILGVLYVFTTVLSFFLVEIILEDFAQIPSHTAHFRATINPLSKSLTCGFFILASLGLLFGSHMKIRFLFLPYMLSIQAIILGSLSLGLALIHREERPEGQKGLLQKMAGFFFIFIGVVNIYFLMVILSHYVDLGEYKKGSSIYRKPPNKVEDIPPSSPRPLPSSGSRRKEDSRNFDIDSHSVIYLS